MQTNFPPDEPPALTPGDWLRRGLVVALPVTCLVGAIAMLVQIEVLVGFFPVCGLLGLALAVAAAPLGVRPVARFGQSAPIAASACAAAIAGFRLSPGEAYLPINVAWSLYTAGMLICCWWPIRIIWSRPNGSPEAARSAWRFSLRGMLILTSVVAVALTLAKLFGIPVLEAIAHSGGYSAFAFFAVVGIVLAGLAISNSASYRRRGVGLFRRASPAPDTDRGESQRYLYGEKIPTETPPPDQIRG
ncbi:hypothetical protein Pla123a_08410 [Posidoniimonas polymericola]|uniref:Uncharacterized protein n=1 Tax=Posidoniimonas polymericola TaxID=2528002 RepID=A0A5C5YST1_9BACT|nr:hypothetical protein [Posidoniimonas polymericola]TWT78052.1 hypothetical protein Pla123a_08410 [Posidoniimonas polymericola]